MIDQFKRLTSEYTGPDKKISITPTRREPLPFMPGLNNSDDAPTDRPIPERSRVKSRAWLERVSTPPHLTC
jgi:hypothetical protein